MSRLSFALLFTLTAFTVRAQFLEGTIEGNTYISPTGQFSIAIPVRPELGGDITDTPNVVTFQDDFNLHVSIAAFKQDATQRWEHSTRGAKDYLVYFFSNFVLADFRQTFSGVKIESAKFLPGMLDGALLTYLLVPGGTMFADRVPALVREHLPVAKRGNLLFVRNEHVFVISMELAERVTEGKAFDKTTEQEDEILRNRLNDIVAKIKFTAPAKPPATETAKK